MQRFVNELQPGGPTPSRAFKDAVLTHALRAAEREGRVLSVMFDISGASEDEWASTILLDWAHIVDALNATASPAWLHHKGKPVLSVWGLGFTGHPGTPASSLQFLSALRAARGDVTRGCR